MLRPGGRPNAKLQTPNFKLQRKDPARVNTVWRLVFEVWRLAFSPPQAPLHRFTLCFAQFVLVFCTAANPIAQAAEEIKESAPEQVSLPPVEPGAQTGPADLIPPGAGANSPSANVTINLIKRMVQKGLLTKEDATDLLKQAEADAAIARVQIQQDAIAAAQIVVAQAVASGTMADPVPMPDDAVRVTYIPESVKKQIRDEIKTDVMAKAKDENWVAPNKIPGWVTRFRVSGDLRIRGERDLYPSGNDNTGAFPNFNAINTGSPFDTAGTVFSPQLNVDQDRTRIRLRARIGAEIEMGDGFTAGLRIATGDSNTPTSTNQSLGLANSGQGGQFSKYAIWLDRAFLKYEIAGKPGNNLALLAGRFDNPFFSTDLIYDEDVGFDGGALQASREILKGVTPFFNGGAFPVFNTDFNFSSNQPAKFKSTDKWLYGAQGGVDLKLRKDLTMKIGGAYYYFDGVEGKLSTPYTPLTASDAGNTDTRRPSFAQKGNTYTPLRNIVPNASNNFGTTNQFQYFGLASKFRPVALTGKLEYSGFEPVTLTLTGEYIKNLGFNRGAIDRIAVNNRAANNAAGTTGHFAGGDTAWIIGLKAGSATMAKRWDWQIGVNYRRVESDAVIDGFNDSDFGHGGTNQEGYVLSAALALSPRFTIGARWLSSDEIAGPPLKSDIFMLDLTGKF